MSTVHVVVPEAVDDPTRPSGGNAYDRRVCDGLRERGWTVVRHLIPGAWPRADPVSLRALTKALAGIPDDSVALLDALVTSAVPAVVVPESRRLRLVALVHAPLGQGPGAPGGTDLRSAEGAVLRSAAAVVATSRWTADWLRAAYGLPPARVVVVTPGVSPAAVVVGSPSGSRLVCVGAVTPTKGQDVLVEALADVVDLEWSCTCVGSLSIDPAFAGRVLARAEAVGLKRRVVFSGPRVGEELQAVYAAADVLLAPSRTETYGMVVTEALARGIPVLATDVGGLPEAVGRTPGGRRPGLLVPPEDHAALGRALRRWLTDSALRRVLQGAARERGATLSAWSSTTDRIEQLLHRVGATEVSA